jgi:cytochrome c peroxidase
MRNSLVIIGLAFLSLSFVVANENDLFNRPSYFPKPNYNFKNNPLDSNIILLGRILFYEPNLSADQRISCASCHSPYNAFAHTDHDLSHGIFDSIGTRNAPALFNLAWQEKFMWDGAINHLDMQALAPISHAKEMGSSLDTIVKKLNESQSYKSFFHKAFRDSLATGAKVLKALSQFQLTLVSANAKYDKVTRGEDTFTIQEKNGYRLFKNNCSSCHQEPLFSTYAFENNGLPIDPTLNDYGRMHITNNLNDSLKFKVPSLRNLSFTYPYMHDGRFTNLREVIHHYTNGIKKINSLSHKLKEPIQLTANEKVDLIAFLLTLNDKEFVFDKKHQFKNNDIAAKE